MEQIHHPQMVVNTDYLDAIVGISTPQGVSLGLHPFFKQGGVMWVVLGTNGFCSLAIDNTYSDVHALVDTLAKQYEEQIIYVAPGAHVTGSSIRREAVSDSGRLAWAYWNYAVVGGWVSKVKHIIVLGDGYFTGAEHTAFRKLYIEGNIDIIYLVGRYVFCRWERGVYPDTVQCSVHKGTRCTLECGGIGTTMKNWDDKVQDRNNLDLESYRQRVMDMMLEGEHMGGEHDE